ncbi:tumor necrosis factor receptor superfamily member 6-like [Arapaima gigas]
MSWHNALLFLLVGVAEVARVSCAEGTRCLYGTYNHSDVTCCTCQPGTFVSKHCSATDQTECLPCEEGFYNSLNNSESCTPCDLCNENVFLKVKTPCGKTQNTQCKCKEGYYCLNNECRHCLSCDTCEDHDNVIECNSVCEKPKDIRLIVGIVVPLFIILIIIIVCIIYQKGIGCSEPDCPPPNNNANQQEMDPLLEDLNLSSYLYTIVELVGPSGIKKLAIQGGITQAAIDMHVQSYPNNVKDQCVNILKDWYERQDIRVSNIFPAPSAMVVYLLLAMCVPAVADKLAVIL